MVKLYYNHKEILKKALFKLIAEFNRYNLSIFRVATHAMKRKIAPLIMKKWPVKYPLSPLMIVVQGVRLLRECESKGDPTGALRRGGSRGRPRKANTWHGNHQGGKRGHFIFSGLPKKKNIYF